MRFPGSFKFSHNTNLPAPGGGEEGHLLEQGGGVVGIVDLRIQILDWEAEMDITYRNLTRFNFANQPGYEMRMSASEAEAVIDALQRALKTNKSITVTMPGIGDTDFRVSTWRGGYCIPSQELNS